ncbi:hypothetical protein ACSSVV_001733 [Marinobacter sp. MBR-105]|jgi:hypothetical protein
MYVNDAECEAVATRAKATDWESDYEHASSNRIRND